MKNTNETLKRIGRIETSTNTLEKIIELVYSSPYTDKDNYIENINDMQEVFYYFKSQVLDLLSDDEVIDISKITSKFKFCCIFFYKSLNLKNLSFFIVINFF